MLRGTDFEYLSSAIGISSGICRPCMDATSMLASRTHSSPPLRETGEDGCAAVPAIVIRPLDHLLRGGRIVSAARWGFLVSRIRRLSRSWLSLLRSHLRKNIIECPKLQIRILCNRASRSWPRLSRSRRIGSRSHNLSPFIYGPRLVLSGLGR